MQPSTVVARNPRIVHRHLAEGDGGVLLHLDTAAYHGVNDVGSLIWDLLERPASIAEVIAGVRERVDEAPPTVDDDVTSFVRDLVDRDILVVTT